MFPAFLSVLVVLFLLVILCLQKILSRPKRKEIEKIYFTSKPKLVKVKFLVRVLSLSSTSHHVLPYTQNIFYEDIEFMYMFVTKQNNNYTSSFLIQVPANKKVCICHSSSLSLNQNSRNLPKINY